MGEVMERPSLMDLPSPNIQLAVVSLAALFIGSAVAVYVHGSGLTTAVVPEMAGPLSALLMALAIFAAGLLWLRHRYGYVAAMIAGIVFIVDMAGGLLQIAAGDAAVDWLILMIPGIIFALIVLGATYAAWRE